MTSNFSISQPTTITRLVGTLLSYPTTLSVTDSLNNVWLAVNLGNSPQPQVTCLIAGSPSPVPGTILTFDEAENYFNQVFGTQMGFPGNPVVVISVSLLNSSGVDLVLMSSGTVTLANGPTTTLTNGQVYEFNLVFDTRYTATATITGSGGGGSGSQGPTGATGANGAGITGPTGPAGGGGGGTGSSGDLQDAYDLGSNIVLSSTGPAISVFRNAGQYGEQSGMLASLLINNLRPLYPVNTFSVPITTITDQLSLLPSFVSTSALAPSFTGSSSYPGTGTSSIISPAGATGFGQNFLDSDYFSFAVVQDADVAQDNGIYYISGFYEATGSNSVFEVQALVYNASPPVVNVQLTFTTAVVTICAWNTTIGGGIPSNNLSGQIACCMNASQSFTTGSYGLNMRNVGSNTNMRSFIRLENNVDAVPQDALVDIIQSATGSISYPLLRVTQSSDGPVAQFYQYNNSSSSPLMSLINAASNNSTLIVTHSGSSAAIDLYNYGLGTSIAITQNSSSADAININANGTAVRAIRYSPTATPMVYLDQTSSGISSDIRFSNLAVQPSTLDAGGVWYENGSGSANELTGYKMRYAPTASRAFSMVPMHTVFGADPSVTDDYSNGFPVGCMWLNTSSGTTFICRNNSNGAAAWVALN